ncbi:hypothetical protein ACOCJ4_07085 [Knoellia sp. CPCC 206435]|uniref:hypothetical protein n=1 Tax=Knoellia terrae TaxID=3404797 RepID=UPI003B42BF48
MVGIAAAAMVGAGMGGTAVAQPAQVSSAAAASSFEGAQGTYKAVSPTRVLDTRTGNGAPKALVGAQGEVSLLVAGRGGVPSGVSAVVLNLTAVTPSSDTWLTAYPSGTPRPATSNVNTVAKATRANLVTVPVGTDGRVRIYNQAGTTDILADVMGYYHGEVAPATGVGAQYYTLDPERWFDSRSEGGALAPGEIVTISADFGPGAADVVALATNVTVLQGSRPGFVSAGGTFGPQAPTYSTLNYGTGQVIANMSVGSSGVSGTEVLFSVRNGGTGTVQAIVDVVGIYVSGDPEGLRYRPLAPRRTVDTRSGIGGTATPLGANEPRLFTAPTTVAGLETYALVTNTTVVRPTVTTYVTAYSNDLPKPPVSNVNAARGEVAANSAFIPLGDGERFRVHNAAGQAHLITDVFGSFEYHTGAASAGAAERSSGTERSAAPSPASVRVGRG